MQRGSHETEIKLAVPDVRTARRLIRAAGFEIYKRRVFETNTIYDTPTDAVRRSSRLLRLRQAGGVVTLTYKGPPVVSRHKSREELELEIGDFRSMGAILERLGYRAASRYEKYRTEYRQAKSRGIATIDETPVGVFIELEGAPSGIDRTARRLGFAEGDYLTVSYSRLYLDWCAANGIEPSDMVFAQAR